MHPLVGDGEELCDGRILDDDDLLALDRLPVDGVQHPEVRHSPDRTRPDHPQPAAGSVPYGTEPPRVRMGQPGWVPTMLTKLTISPG